MLHTLSCIVIGETTAFPVDIDETQTVGELKDAIKEKKQVALKAIDANKLTLYRAIVNESDYKQKQTRINELKRLSQNLNECTKLDNKEQQFSGFFGESPSQGKKCYTLVQIPIGQSIDSRACDMLRLTPTSSAHCPLDNSMSSTHCTTRRSATRT